MIHFSYESCSEKNIHEHRIDDEQNYQNLTSHREYTVIGIDDENYRILNDANEPILYPKSCLKLLTIGFRQDGLEKNIPRTNIMLILQSFQSLGFMRIILTKDEAIDVFNKNINKYK
ncbi:MAG: hypothetical protein HZT40_13580 [Candidatus Thiothrix singaporensis]|uniref:Uncharacterized protein n=1 Tax=Candidatus Thiothrix singaporensis TaxID=2799669 RepID=A0A7L6ATR0_9GAMM|nr:MAG: hypothetical protein HZT40_13580 [Candidatus Thiothrix singaporensis]